MDQKEINKRMLETLGEFKSKIDDLNKRLDKLEKDSNWIRDRVFDLKNELNDILLIGEYKMSNCAYLKDGECTVWKRGDKPLTSKMVCAVCLVYMER